MSLDLWEMTGVDEKLTTDKGETEDTQGKTDESPQLDTERIREAERSLPVCSTDRKPVAQTSLKLNLNPLGTKFMHISVSSYSRGLSHQTFFRPQANILLGQGHILIERIWKILSLNYSQPEQMIKIHGFL